MKEISKKRRLVGFLACMSGMYSALFAFNSMSEMWHIPVYGLLGFTGLVLGCATERKILRGSETVVSVKEDSQND